MLFRLKLAITLVPEVLNSLCIAYIRILKRTCSASIVRKVIEFELNKKVVLV